MSWLLTRRLLACLLMLSISFAQAAEMVQSTMGRAKIVRLSSAADRVAIGDPKIADFTVINAKELYVLGKTVGSTSLTYWNKSGKSSSMVINVGVDVEPLIQTLAQVLPKEKEIQVTSAANSIVLNGFVNNTVAGEAAYNLADAYAKNIARTLGQGGGVATTGAAQGGGVAPAVFGTQVINLLKVRDAQQVMLEVRVAEISKDLLEKIGVSFIGGTNLTGEYAGNGFRWAVPPSTATGGLVGWLLANTAGAAVDLEQKDALVKILAAPTIVAVSGQEGRFLVGGKAFLPVAQSGGNLGAITLQEQDFGVGLKFIPTVLENGRISLKVSPEVSEITNQTITSSTGGANNAATFPVFVTRQASTTVQLQNGQSLVIGGLLRNNVSEVVNSIPFLGQLPVLGPLFRSSQFVQNKTELIIVVRPILVDGTAKAPELPTDNYIQPTKTEFFLEGKLEGTPKPVPPTENSSVSQDSLPPNRAPASPVVGGSGQ